MILLATIQWHARLAPFWCAGLLLGVACLALECWLANLPPMKPRPATAP